MPYKDPAARAAYAREYKRRNRHRYRDRRRAYDSAKHANERAAMYGAPGELTVDEVLTIFARGQCHYCSSTHLLGLDHVRPLHVGGPNRPHNIVLSCRRCNASKWRADQPWRWARDHDACVDCGTTERKHRSSGRCNRCYCAMRAESRAIAGRGAA